MSHKNDSFYLDKEEPIKSCLLAMRDILLAQDDEVTETTKYGMPCFCYKGKMFCYLWTDKKTNNPYFLMVEGKHLTHPQLMQGDRARMKTFNIDPNKDIPISTINEIMQTALDLYRNGTIKIK